MLAAAARDEPLPTWKDGQGRSTLPEQEGYYEGNSYPDCICLADLDKGLPTRQITTSPLGQGCPEVQDAFSVTNSSRCLAPAMVRRLGPWAVAVGLMAASAGCAVSNRTHASGTVAQQASGPAADAPPSEAARVEPTGAALPPQTNASLIRQVRYSEPQETPKPAEASLPEALPAPPAVPVPTLTLDQAISVTLQADPKIRAGTGSDPPGQCGLADQFASSQPNPYDGRAFPAVGTHHAGQAGRAQRKPTSNWDTRSTGSCLESGRRR